MLIYGASNTESSREEAEEDSFNLLEIIEEPSVDKLADKPLEQPTKALTREHVDHQNEEPAWQVGDWQPQVLTAEDGWQTKSYFWTTHGKTCLVLLLLALVQEKNAVPSELDDRQGAMALSDFG